MAPETGSLANPHDGPAMPCGFAETQSGLMPRNSGQTHVTNILKERTA
jgi:hypothetical protein